MSPKLEHIAGLECLSLRKTSSRVGVVLLHGYGASMHDLFPLWQLWDHEELSWYFPNGILSLNMGPYEGRAWFSIDVAELERSIREGKSRDLKNKTPPEFDSTLKVLESFLREIMQRHEVIILGGFSQGAMCASHLATRNLDQIQGVILLSGALLAEASFPVSARSLPFYQSHGTLDPILGIEGAKDLERKLQHLNFSGRLHTFQGGHEIPMSVIHEVKNFLNQFFNE